MSTICPKCNNEVFCPCDSCVDRHQQSSVWLQQGENQACPHCGLSRHAVWWLDYEVLLAAEAKQWPSWERIDTTSMRERMGLNDL